MRDCPTVEGSSIPLIIHRIQASDCLSRQGCNYHKCHRCIFRGRAADWVPTDATASRGAATGERAVPTHRVDMPRPEVGPELTPVPRKGAPKAPGKRRSKQPSPA